MPLLAALVVVVVVPLLVRGRRGRRHAGVEAGHAEYVAVGEGSQPQEVPGEAFVAASGGGIAAVAGVAMIRPGGPLLRSKVMRCPEAEGTSASARHVACSCRVGSASASIGGGGGAVGARHLSLVRRPAQRCTHLRGLLQQRGGRHVRRGRPSTSGGRRGEPDEAAEARRALMRGAPHVVLLV